MSEHMKHMMKEEDMMMDMKKKRHKRPRPERAGMQPWEGHEERESPHTNKKSKRRY